MQPSAHVLAHLLSNYSAVCEKQEKPKQYGIKKLLNLINSTATNYYKDSHCEAA